MGEEYSRLLRSIGFSLYSAEEVRALSVKEITSPIVVDNLNKPVPNGLYDPAMGPEEQSDLCETCGEKGLHCPGHFGHIILPLGVYNPLLYRWLFKILRSVCLMCHRFKHDASRVEKAIRDFTAIVGDNVSEARTTTARQSLEASKIIEEFLRSPKQVCPNCSMQSHTLKSEGHGRLYQQPLSSRRKADNAITGTDLKKPKVSKAKKVDAEPTSKNQLFNPFFSDPRILMPAEVKQHLKLFWEKEERICTLFWGGKAVKRLKKPWLIFFLDVLPVPPNRFRPANHINNMIMEHAQNILYGKIIQAKIGLSDYISEVKESGIKEAEKGVKLWLALQNAVNELFDSTTVTGKDRGTGIRQMLEKKEGLFRWHMMGKRVNHCCRSVISPDPYIAVNEVGIPPNFAIKLTYPEKVTPWNAERLRRNVENGPFVHPGATHVEDEHGVRISLQHIKPFQRIAIAKTLLSTPSTAHGTSENKRGAGKTVYRHLQDGDILLCNRQPTLHKPSLMGHIARVIKGQRALRLHYANCSTYNADFDGDEMNVHFPQDELGRSEGYQIVNANQQYVVPTSGEPIRGLIQDHIVSAALLTKKDTYLTKDEYQQIVYAACVPMPTSRTGADTSVVKVLENDPMLKTEPPAILKPQRLWTGKQVMTSILEYVTRGRPPFSFGRGVRVSGDYIGKKSEELNVLVKDNELIHGIIDKAQFGKFGMVHAVQELYGADDAGHLLSVFSRLFSFYLQMHGFTCGIADMLLLPNAEETRTEKLKKAAGDLGDIVHGRYIGVEEKDQWKVNIEEIKDQTGKILQTRGDQGRARLDMLMSSAMNAVTSAVNNALFPGGLMKPFPHNCLCLMTVTGAKGGMVNFTQISTLLGQQELEGKRVPRMISGKTLPCFQPYEPVARSGGFISDRFLTGLRPQEYYFHCMAGRDGLVDTAVKTAKSGYLQRCIIKNLECLRIAYDYTVRDSDGSVIQFCYGEDGVDVLKSSCLTNFELLSTNRDLLTIKLGLGESAEDLDEIDMGEDAYINDVPESINDQLKKFIKKSSTKDRERMLLRKNHHVNTFRMLLKHKYFSSLAAPGEPVGVLAGQSIGEPSTQMTLNTFHFAGRGEMNVTLGIPRLHEILTVASKSIKTPVMTVPLVEGRPRDVAERLAASLMKISLADILESVDIGVVPFHVEKGSASKMYKVVLKLYPWERFPAHMQLKKAEIDHAIRTRFAREVQKEIVKEVKLLTQVSAKNSIQMLGVTEDAGSDAAMEDGGDDDESANKKKKSSSTKVEVGETVEDDDDEEEDEEGGADAAKRKGQATDEAVYSDSDDEAEELGKDGKAREEDTDSDGRDSGRESDEEKEEDEGETVEEERPATKGKKAKKSTGLSYEMKFSTDPGSPHIFLPNIIEKVLKNLNVRKVHKIEKCAVIDYKGDSSKPALQTDGVNFDGLWTLGDDLDLNKLHCNDIAAVLRTYGVEAARATIVSEVQGVFGSYGIAVNVRHLGLIADFMTFSGGYKALNRIGINSNTSPFLKMSFETATNFLIEASLKKQQDLLDTPSSRIIVGRAVDLGTGCFELLQKVDTEQ